MNETTKRMCKSANNDRINYQFLGGTFRQGIAVAQIVDLEILDKVSIRNVGFAWLPFRIIWVL